MRARDPRAHTRALGPALAPAEWHSRPSARLLVHGFPCRPRGKPGEEELTHRLWGVVERGHRTGPKKRPRKQRAKELWAMMCAIGNALRRRCDVGGHGGKGSGKPDSSSGAVRQRRIEKGHGLVWQSCWRCSRCGIATRRLPKTAGAQTPTPLRGDGFEASRARRDRVWLRQAVSEWMPTNGSTRRNDKMEMREGR